MSDTYPGLQKVVDCWTGVTDTTAKRARAAIRKAGRGKYGATDLAHDIVGFYDDAIDLDRVIDYWDGVAKKTTQRARDAIRAAERGRYGADDLARDVVRFYDDIVPLAKIVDYWADVTAKTSRRAHGALETAKRNDLTVAKVARGVIGLSDDMASAAIELCDSVCGSHLAAPIDRPGSGPPTIPVNAKRGQDVATGTATLGLAPGTVLTCDDLKHDGLPAAVDITTATASVTATGDVVVTVNNLNADAVPGFTYEGDVRDAGTPVAHIVLSVGT